jgi:hypothetical protein
VELANSVLVFFGRQLHMCKCGRAFIEHRQTVVRASMPGLQDHCLLESDTVCCGRYVRMLWKSFALVASIACALNMDEIGSSETSIRIFGATWSHGSSTGL